MRKASDEAARFLESLPDEKFRPEGRSRFNPDAEKAWKKISDKVGKSRKGIYFLVASAAIAASVALFLISPHTGLKESDEIYPIDGAVTLKLADGKVFDLEEREIELPSAFVVNKETKSLDYSAVAETETIAEKEDVKINELTVARGRTYKVVLSDGSKVHLNSGSTISFPETFATDERRIRLSGEAYFDIVKDAERPFIVETGSCSVSVLGTSFDLCAYPGEPITTATLVSGQVAVAAAGNEVILSPSHQFRMDNATNMANVVEVDPSEYTSWMNDELKIKKMHLSEILDILQRRYEFTYTLSERAKEVVFSGTIPMDSPLGEILDQLCGVHQLEYKIEGTKVIIK